MIRILFSVIFISLCSINLSAKSYLPSATGEIVEHNYYTLSYVEEHEQAEWVFYLLTPNMINGTAPRKDNFRADKDVSTGSSSLADYKASGYDRGHLAPAASMTIDEIAMSESFLMSNMSPQAPSFNRGVWKRLEERVRDYASNDSLLYVVTGPILNDVDGSIGQNRVSIPKYYYKVLYSPQKEAMIAFLLQNEKSAEPLEEFAITVDELERITGIDFFVEYNSTLEPLESTIDLLKWIVE